MPINNWSKRHEKCLECGTTRLPHKAKGLCIKCHPVVRGLKQISTWNFHNPETLIGFPMGMPLVGEDFVKRVQQGLMGEYQDRLADLKRWESPSGRDLSGLTFESLFNQVSHHCKTKNKNMFFGYANIFDHNFNKEHKQILYQMIASILVDMPWRINWNRVFSRTRNRT